MVCVNELLVYVGLHKIKAIVSCILANTLQQLRGYALSLHTRCNYKAKYGFDPNVCMVLLYGPIRTQIIDAELAIRVGVTPPNDFIAAIRKIAL